MTTYDWEKSAACAQVGGDLWFPGYGESSRPAMDICWSCPVREACLEAAMAEEHPTQRRHSGRHGIRGGYTANGRAQLQRRRDRTAARRAATTPTT